MPRRGLHRHSAQRWRIRLIRKCAGISVQKPIVRFYPETQRRTVTARDDTERSPGTGWDGTSANETLNNLFFETGHYNLADKSRTELDRLAAFIQANPAVKIEISGHTDDKGDAAANLVLSQKRAQSVVTYFTKAGWQPTGSGPLARKNPSSGTQYKRGKPTVQPTNRMEHTIKNLSSMGIW